MLATLLLMQLRRQLSFFTTRAYRCLKFSLASTRTPMPFSAKLLNGQPPAYTGTQGYSSPDAGLGNSLCCLLKSLWTAAQSSVMSHSSQFCINRQIYCRYPASTPRSLRKMLNNIDHWHKALGYRPTARLCTTKHSVTLRDVLKTLRMWTGKAFSKNRILIGKELFFFSPSFYE